MAKMTTPAVHPFDPITPEEIKASIAILRNAFPDSDLRFKVVDLQEPVKQDVIPYIEAERLGQPLPTPPARLVHALFHKTKTGAFMKALVEPSAGKVIFAKELPKDVQGPVDVDELIAIEQVCLKHPAVIAEVEKMKLPHGVTVCNDPWIYGTDDEGENRRLFQCYMYVLEKDHPESNHYSLPCTWSPVFDAMTQELVRMDYLPVGTGHEYEETQPWKPVKTIEYAHELLDEPLRKDLKPYIVQQPEGPSFNLDGHLVEWQKWKFRVGFNAREGMVLYNVTYDGRNVFYRLALSEMTVPYGVCQSLVPLRQSQLL